MGVAQALPYLQPARGHRGARGTYPGVEAWVVEAACCSCSRECPGSGPLEGEGAVEAGRWNLVCCSLCGVVDSANDSAVVDSELVNPSTRRRGSCAVVVPELLTRTEGHLPGPCFAAVGLWDRSAGEEVEAGGCPCWRRAAR